MSEEEPKPEKKKAMPFVRKVEARILRMAQRTREYRTKTAKFASPELDAELATADKALRAAVGLLVDMPDTIGYAVKASKASIQIGSTVAIRDNQRASYEGVLTDEDMINLTVTKIAKTRIVAETASGSSLVLQRGHLILEAAQ